MTDPAPPAAPPTEITTDAMSSEQATAEIARTRADSQGDWHHAGRPGHAAAVERMHRLYQRAATSPTSEPVRPETGSFTDRVKQAYESAEEPPPAPPSVFDVPGENPRTAVELNAMQLPAFAPEAQKAGWGWDEAKVQAVHATAEQEGLAPLVRDGEHLITQLALEPPPDLEVTDRQVMQKWGSHFPAKMDAVDRFEALLRAKHPEVLAELERTGKSEHPAWLEYAARVGEEMVNPLSPAGMARVKAKYTAAKAR